MGFSGELESDQPRPMKSAILRDNQGYDILVNGIPRTFRDAKEIAYDAARVIKRRNKGDIVEIVDRSTGAKLIMLQDGRTG